MSVDTFASTTVSGGVEMQGLQLRNAPVKVSPTVPVVEKAVFVPYTEELDGKTGFQEYAKCCASVTKKMLQNLVSVKGISLPNKALFDKYLESLTTGGVGEEPDYLERYSQSDNSGMLSLLQKLLSLSTSEIFMEQYRNILLAYKSELLQDKLLSSHLTPRSLKPCLDLVIENLNSNVVRVLEVQASESKMFADVLKHFNNQPAVQVEYAAADTSEALGLADVKSEMDKNGIEALKWTTDNEPAEAEVYDLVVANNIIHNQTNLSKSLQNISKSLRADGFLLMVEVTRNHVIYMAFEGLENKIPECEDRESRNISCYCNEKQWEKLLESEGFRVVSVKSDGSLNTTFLARKVGKVEMTMQIVLKVDGKHSEWLDRLKDEMARIQDKPKGHNLWLISEQGDASGIIGMTNCVRKEAGGEKVRYVLNLIIICCKTKGKKEVCVVKMNKV